MGRWVPHFVADAGWLKTDSQTGVEALIDLHHAQARGCSRSLARQPYAASLFSHAMPDEMTSEVGECNSHFVKPEQNGIDCCPQIVLVWYLEDIAHNDLIID